MLEQLKKVAAGYVTVTMLGVKETPGFYKAQLKSLLRGDVAGLLFNNSMELMDRVCSDPRADAYLDDCGVLGVLLRDKLQKVLDA
jgi:hypothetical protein